MSHNRGVEIRKVTAPSCDIDPYNSSLKSNCRININVDMAIESIATNCQLIASQAEHLHRMRQRCHPTAQLAQQEIRNIEEKILKLFSLQLLTKREIPATSILPDDLKDHPSIRQWLEVIGLNKEAVEKLCSHLCTLEELLLQDIAVLQSLADQCRVDQLQRVKFLKAVGNLKKYTESQLSGSNKSPPTRLHWDSWELCHNRVKTSHRASVSSSDGESGSGNSDSSTVLSITSSFYSNAMSIKGSDTSSPSRLVPQSPIGSSPGYLSATCTFQDKFTPPTTPPVVIKTKPSGDKRFPPTPPPGRKNILQSTKQPPLFQVQDPQHLLGRSTSHESRLSLRIDSEAEAKDEPGEPIHDQSSRRSRLQSDSEVCNKPVKVPIPDVKVASSWGDLHEERQNPGKSICDTRIKRGSIKEDGSNKSIPKTKKKAIVPGSMGHNVHHRFTITLKRETCGYCRKKIPFSAGLKCKECNFKCHRDCKSKIAPSCGLPPEMLEYFINANKEKGLDTNRQCLTPSHITERHQLEFSANISSSQPSVNCFSAFQTHDSSSNTSSCNSSTPSSPALMVPPSPARKGAFPFPDKLAIWEYNSRGSYHANTRNENIDSRLSHDSEKTLSNTSGSGSTGTDDSERTVAGRVDSQDSTVSESDCSDSHCIRQNSVTSVSQALREWDIPYDELEHGDIIGKGRFATVYAGNWHGQIAIKELNIELVNDEKTLEAFKAEVSTFRKTRHENLVLFMGACMKPPRFAIVTSLVKGYTLYQHIHAMKEKFSLSRTIPIARQIVQGMSYLHGRGIVHKDVKTKNIFLETNERVVVTDFGLFNVTRLCYNRRGDSLSIPHGWLCYLAPEIIRKLRLDPKPDDGLPFTPFSDVFAFGTVWYELLCGEWPHRDFPPETVIWQVGRGMKPSLAHLQASTNVKDILMLCWSYKPEQRPQFSSLLDDFHKLPKKRLDRSPSHPIQLSRSAESVF